MISTSEYKRMMDDSQQLSADLDESIEENPDDEELKETREFLADRYWSLLFLLDG